MEAFDVFVIFVYCLVVLPRLLLHEGQRLFVQFVHLVLELQSLVEQPIWPLRAVVDSQVFVVSGYMLALVGEY